MANELKLEKFTPRICLLLKGSSVMVLMLVLVWSSCTEPVSIALVPNDGAQPLTALPDPLITANNDTINNRRKWERSQRGRILRLFENQVYGKAPRRPLSMRYEVTKVDSSALNGRALREEVQVSFGPRSDEMIINLLVYRPLGTPAPVFLGMNFWGNQSISSDTSISISGAWMRENLEKGIENHRATVRSRGVAASRWPLEEIISRGYAVVTFYYGDIDPDKNDFSDGVHSHYYSRRQDHPDPDQWGSIAAWAWGLSRAMDYIITSPTLDEEHVAVIGHSRLGKAALWAGAVDERFAMVISNNSGCGGAALSRRQVGESVADITSRFPHWFCDNFDQYANREKMLPLDQHMLLTLMAPRNLYIASASEDLWADPEGEFLSLKLAEPVYALYGIPGVGLDRFPGPGTFSHTHMAYHLRKGAHDITAWDWARYMDYADRYLKPREQ